MDNFENLLKRFLRLLRLQAIVSIVLFLWAGYRLAEEGHRNFIFLKDSIDFFREHSGLLRSPEFLIVMGVLWLAALIVGPDLHKYLPWRMLVGKTIRLRTWIEESDRHELLNKRLEKCRSDEVVRFIAFTGKSVLLPEVEGKKLGDHPFPRAVNQGTVFHGLLLDPKSTEAEFRSKIETPNTPKDKRLLQRHAELVAELPEAYEKAKIRVFQEQVQLKYTTRGLAFSLWLFNDVALVEPYHLGRREGVGNLCEFAQMIIPVADINYQLLVDHFNNLWTDEAAQPVWNNALGQGQVK